MRGSAAFRVGVAPGGALAPSWVRDPLSRNAGASPSLDLRFADSKSLVDSTTGAGLVTFTRASSGTYVGSDGLIKTATTNEARFDHNPTTGESLGLLVEEQRTNLALRSEEFNTTWTQNNISISADSITSPTGATTADKITETVANNEHNALQAVSVVANTAYTLSCYAKKGERSILALSPTAPGVANYYTWFNLDTGVVLDNTAGNTASIISMGNGWYRCVITRTTGASQTTVNAKLGISNLNGTSSYTGDGTSGIYLWGAQLEAGSFPTSYIPTTTATVTRSADVASITGSNFSSWYNQTEGTVFAEYQQYAAGGTATNISDNTGSNFINIFTSAAANARGSANVFTSGTNNGRIDSGGTFVANSNTRAIYGLSAGSRSLSAQGNTVSTAATPATLPTVNQMYVGVNQDATSGWNNGTIRRLTYWPFRLPNATLQQITR